MSAYEVSLGNVTDSTFAIGDNNTVVGKGGRLDRGDLTEALSVLFGIVSKYTDPAADEVLKLAVAARSEISADKPEKEIFRRLVDATGTMMNKLGSKIIEAGALAGAVAKIGEVLHHL